MRYSDLSLPRALLSLIVAACLLAAGCSRDSPQSLLASGKESAEKGEHATAIIHYKTLLQDGTESAEIRYLLGVSLLRSGDSAGAVTELGKALELGRSKDEVIPLIASALLQSGEYRKLVTQYEATDLGSPPALAALKVSLAAAWARLGDAAKTEASVAAALRAVPDFGPALVVRARLMAVGREFDGAIALLERAIKQDPNNHEALHLKGEILALAKGDAQGGAAAMKQALVINPAYVPSHAGLVSLALASGDLAAAKSQLETMRKALPKHPHTLFLDAQLAYQSGDLAKARELSNALLRAASESPEVLQLAGAIEAQAGSMVIAESHFRKALQLNPDLPAVRRSLAIAYSRLGQPQKAFDALGPLIGEGATDGKALSLAGETALSLNDPQTADRLFQRAVKIDPNDVAIRTALAVSQVRQGNALRGLSELQSLSSSTPEATADLALISTRIAQRDWDAALAALDALAKKSPAHQGTAADIRGRVHMARRDTAAARKSFEQALAIDPKLFSAIANLVVIDTLEGRPEEARKRLEAAVAADPRNTFAWQAMAQLLKKQGAPFDQQRDLIEEGIKANPSEPSLRLALVEMHLQSRRMSGALTAAQNAAAALPDDVNVLDALGRSQTTTGNIQQAVSTFRRISNLDPNSILPHSRLADLYASQGDIKGAEASWRRVLELDPNADVAVAKLMELMLANKRAPQALALARQLQKDKPASAAGHLLEGALHRQMGAHGQAVLAYQAGLKREPNRSALAVRLHQALIAAGRADEAEATAKQWLASNPSDTNFAFQVALVDLSRGKLARAEDGFRAVIGKQPGHVMALNNLAWLMAKEGKPGAVVLAERANAISPDSPSLMDTLAFALAAENKTAEAFALQKKAVALAPDAPTFRLSLAKLALKSGDTALARTELETLKKLGQQFSSHSEVTALLKTL